MQITLRNGKKYRRPDGRPICWEGKDEKVEVEKEKTASTSEEEKRS